MAEISIKKAALYNALGKYGTMIVQLGLTMILSRLILPEAYGVVAITSIVIGFLNLFADIGLGINIIQHPEMEKDDIGRLFSFSLSVGVVLAILTALAAFPISVFYDNSIYYTLCPLVSIVTFFNAANVVPNAVLMRDKRFKTIAIRTIVCAAVSGGVAVVLAFLALGVYALVAQVIISSLFLFIWNYANVPVRPVAFKTKNVLHLLGSYSLFQVLFNFLNFFTRNLDNMLIGRYFGAASLAHYNKSYFLYLYPNNIFASVITGVLHPFIREYKNDAGMMYEKYMQIMKFLSLIGVFTMITFFVCSREMVLLVFGPNWELAGTYLKCLSICMWTQMMGSVSGSIFLGVERTDQTFKCGIINLSLLILAILCGIYYHDMIVLSFGVGIAYNLIFIITNYILIVRTLHQSSLKLYKRIGLDGGFAFAVLAVSLLLPEISDSLVLSLIYKFLFCLVLYVAYLLVTRQMNILKSMLLTIKK